MFSFVVHHAPKVPGRTLPFVIALVELEEGVRMLGELRSVDPVDRCGRNARPRNVYRLPRGDTGPGMDAVRMGAGRMSAPTISVGTKLPELSLYGDPTFIVSTAIATRDYQDVHHDRDKAQAKGSKDIFVNILTDTGLVQRYITDWAGPTAIIKSIKLRLGVPWYAYDTVTFSGEVTAVDDGTHHGESRWQQQPRRPRDRDRNTDHRRERLMAGQLSGKAAIVGIGATDFSKNSGRSELRLASEAVLDALDDAGLTPADVDGMVTFTMDSNTEVAIARATGIGELKFFSKIHHGGGAACATVQQAAIAVATGVADCVVAYRAFNERSGQRFGQVQLRLVENADSTGVDNSFSYPHGLSTPAAQVAMIARRYMHLSGATSKDFGAVSVADRKHAAKNPKAYFYEKPISIEDHQNSRWIAEPLRLLDCCQETDGGVALVITSAERAKDLKHRPAVIEAASQGSSPDQYSMVSYYRPELGLPEMGLVGRQLWEQSGLKPTDIQTAVLYDHFTPFTLIQLEELGFCGKGEAKDFIADGAIEVGGRLPINTHGGQLGEAYIHGMNGIAEGVRQLRGSSVNPVPDVEHVLVTAGTGVPTSGLILG